ncbi:hypothetical protein F5Y09DRAFT_308525 [Xylaria sp. FL1042]|nr:hypothetical protein F5Y09DRAFT_308525 [Xylaria sp. FL1042]
MSLPTNLGIVISGSIVGFIATAVVALRFWARRLARQEFGLDDWLCLASLLFQHIVMASFAVGASNGGMGRDMRLVLAENPSPAPLLFQVRTAQLKEVSYSNLG